jgi:hypothetical protein
MALTQPLAAEKIFNESFYYFLKSDGLNYFSAICQIDTECLLPADYKLIADKKEIASFERTLALGTSVAEFKKMKIFIWRN